MKYFAAGHRESYTLIARKRYMKKMRQHQSATSVSGGNTTWHSANLGPGTQTPPGSDRPERLRGAADLFELLEKAQRSRIDDQRCILPPYFNQLKVAAIYCPDASSAEKLMSYLHAVYEIPTTFCALKLETGTQAT
ncbi:hypothetical protein GWI33_015837 [Rhynchophorus ferrugineus]|uniref:Uncharacterized protein n=1 Tax=Rhynchophorus ferrugineus TaxID=354439 RepID=A0A834I2F3_RHYFE|nr:hypothetical protein GWI33_015837 [Rhynchophorus ferrugineus]